MKKSYMEKYLIPKMDFRVSIYNTYYIPSNGWLQRKYTMTPEVVQCINYLLKTNPKQWCIDHSNLRAVIIALTAAVPLLQLGHGT